MHRQRKKDLNLKPNRSLDKRSSRGMIFENEELRLRTISINEEVDRSQNDVKKLKKENEHLKREIWSLRDEYEKLEDMLKKVCVQANYDQSEFQPMTGYRPDRRVSIGGETLLSAYDSEDEDCASNIFMIDEDGKSFDYSRSIFGFGCSYEENSGVSSSCSLYSNTPLDIDNLQMNSNNITSDYDPGASVGDGSQEPILPLAVPEEDSTFENSDTPNVSSYQNQHRLPMWTHSSELEVVREESENNSSGIHNSSFCNTPSPLAPLNLEIGESDENINRQKNQSALVSPGCTPMIEITPASSPVSQHIHTPEETGTRPGSVFNNEIQDIGCVAVVPKIFQVTSELRIGNDEDNTVKTENSRPLPTPKIGASKIPTAKDVSEKSTAAGVGAGTGATGLPPPSPGTRVKSSSMTKAKQRKMGIRQSSLNFNSKQSSSDMAPITNTQHENQSQSQTMCRRHCPRRNSLVYLHSKSTRGGGSGSGSPILGLADCCPDFYSCYQSEPSLNSAGISQPDEYICASPIVVSTAYNGFDQSVCLCRLSTLPHRQQQAQPNWNSIDKNVAIGVLDEENMELSAQEVIDELEKQFDPSLENIAGVRMMPGRIFICLRSGDAVKKILENESFTIKGQKIKLFDASKRFSTVVLSGLPPDLNDFTVISTLNQFGQVVAPLERRIYKGVDISERICHMHLVKNLQPVLAIAGYEVRAKIVSQCQELPLSAENEKQELPSTSVTNKSSEVASKNTSPRIFRAPRLMQSLKNFQTAADPKQSTTVTQTQNQQGQVPPDLNPQSQSEEESHRLSLHLPTSSSSTGTKTHIPILQSVSTPTHLQSQCQTLKPHKQIVRSSSSAPRLESVSDPAAESALGSLNASILAKRQMSICAATAGNSSAEDHTSRTSLGSNILPPNPKKPLSRLMKSSPGSLIPQSLSGVRRGSTASMQIQKNLGSGDPGSSPTIESANNNNPNVFPSGVNSGRSRVFAHNQSQMSHQSSIPVKRGGIRIDKSYKKEPLPWCGCWGNGCI